MTSPHFQLESLAYQTDADLHQSIRALMLSARVHVQQAGNTSMLQTDQQIAKLIEEEEQGGQQRAAKTKQVISSLKCNKQFSNMRWWWLAWRKTPWSSRRAKRWPMQVLLCITWNTAATSANGVVAMP